MMWWRRGRYPLSGKGSGLYHGWMPDTNLKRLINSPAVPLTVTINRDSGHWHIQLWYHGTTVMEALHPVLVGERWINPDAAPATCSWKDLYLQVALAFDDLAHGTGAILAGD